LLLILYVFERTSSSRGIREQGSNPEEGALLLFSIEHVTILVVISSFFFFAEARGGGIPEPFDLYEVLMIRIGFLHWLSQNSGGFCNLKAGSIRLSQESNY
jgi:hypothetical protein